MEHGKSYLKATDWEIDKVAQRVDIRSALVLRLIIKVCDHQLIFYYHRKA